MASISTMAATDRDPINAQSTPLPAHVKREHSRILGAFARLRPAESEKNATFECVKRVLYAFASVLNGSQYHTQVLCP